MIDEVVEVAVWRCQRKCISPFELVSSDSPFIFNDALFIAETVQQTLYIAV